MDNAIKDGIYLALVIIIALVIVKFVFGFWKLIALGVIGVYLWNRYGRKRSDFD